MRAALCRELEPASKLGVEEVPDPSPGPGQVLIDVEAAGVNYVDALFVEGRYQIKPALPFTPGSEVAGRVALVGEKVTDWSVGDRVFASVGLGGFATKVAVNGSALFSVPENLDAARAATFTQSYCTALFALRDRGGLSSGETVLVLGAGGGVGLATIDTAVALGARAIAAASSAEKRAAAAEAGAFATIDPVAESVKDRTRELTEGRGADLALDPIGGELAEPVLRSLGNGGRYLVIGFASGTIPSLPLNQVLLRNRTVVGVDWGAWAMSNAGANKALLLELLDLVGAGRLHPVAPHTYPLDSIGQALDDLMNRRVVGKVAVVP